MDSRGEPPPLQIRLLGELVVVKCGQPQQLPASKKTRALLAYLVTTARPHTRARLCELLWEGPDDPRGGLRWALSKIRPLVDAERLHADRERVGFTPSGARVDLFEIRALVELGLERAPLCELETAAAAFRGPFLEAHELPDCVAFHAWCVAEREQARVWQFAVLSELIRRAPPTSDDRLRLCRALVALDPLHEPSQIQLIRALCELGRTRAALTECQRFRQLVATHLGSEPSGEFEQLRTTLRVGMTQSRPSSGTSGEVVPVASDTRKPSDLETSAESCALLPLVGRREELQLLGRMVEAASRTTSPLPAVLLLLGDPGAGKSRLLAELARMVRALGGQVLEGKAFEAELVRPYGVWLDALGLVRDTARTGQPAPWPIAMPDDLGQAANRALFFEALNTQLRARAEACRLLLFIVDDIQWLDEGSAALLHFLARHLAQARVLIACAARSGELADNAASLRVVRALERQGNLTRLPVDALTAEEAKQLAAHVNASVDCAQVYVESGGNPLFLIELTRAMGRGDATPPESLAQLIAARLEQIGSDAEQLLPWAAALGRSFDVDVLGRITGLPLPGLLSGLEQLERRAVVRVSGDSKYDFVHDVVRRAAYQQISLPRRRLIHAQIASTLEELWGTDQALALDVLHHAALAGEHERAARACIQAGRHCIRVFAYADAWDISRRGLDHASRLPPALQLPLSIELLGLRAQRPLGDDVVVEVDRGLTHAALQAEQNGLPALAATAYHFLGLLRYGAQNETGAHESALRHGATARATRSTAELLGAARCLAHLERDMDKVAQYLDEAIDAEGSEHESLDLLWARGLLERYRGDYAAAGRDLSRAVALVERERRNWEWCLCLRDLVLTELERESPAAALTLAAELLEVATKVGDEVAQPAAQAFHALAQLQLGETGDWDTLDSALAGIRAADGKTMLAVSANFAAEIALERHEHERAAAYAKEALVAAAPVYNRSQVAVAHATLACVALARGDRARAQAELRAQPEPESLRGFSARARRAVERARTLSTLSTTEPSTLGADASAQEVPHDEL